MVIMKNLFGEDNDGIASFQIGIRGLLHDFQKKCYHANSKISSLLFFSTFLSHKRYIPYCYQLIPANCCRSLFKFLN